MASATPDTHKGPPGRLLGPLYTPPTARAPFATKPEHSRGRFYPEPESPTRTCYQRDRDRILHSTAFRRLKHKTQVFVQSEGDYYRTRMTHSLEVAQIARTTARVLALDEDLAEALALAHDLGHTPFGHAGEQALAAAAVSVGGFDHNAHTLRLITKLEHRYAAFDGLNLTWEMLEGLVKHNGPIAPPAPAPIAGFDANWPLDLSSWPGLEAQLAALADDIAYLTHDIDDGLRAGLFAIDDLAEAPLAGESVRSIRQRHGALELSRFIGELVRTLIGDMVGDLLAETREEPHSDESRLGCRGPHGGPSDGRLFAGGGRPGPGTQGIPFRADVPPSARHGIDEQGENGGRRIVPCLVPRSHAAPRRLGGGMRGGRRRRYRPDRARLYRGHDRPVCITGISSDIP